jgi:cytochrome P450
MAPTLFLQSEVPDPYVIYERMIVDDPVLRDEETQLWAIYSYLHCQSVLTNPLAQIPAIRPDNKEQLNEYSSLIGGQLVRLSNGSDHEISRQMARHLFEGMKSVTVAEIIETHVKNELNKFETDWVSLICKKIPVLCLLNSFGFSREDSAFISEHIEQVVKIMLPNKTKEDVQEINAVSKELYLMMENHLLRTFAGQPGIKSMAGEYGVTKEKILSLAVSNLTGLFIQGYDGQRGLLSNSLLQLLNRPGLTEDSKTNKEFLKKSIMETLRFDPPVHHTSRVAADDFVLQNRLIKKGDLILIVLAAANRDPEQFTQPAVFNIERPNNCDHLTFGLGMHGCLANHYSVNLAAETFSYFFERFRKIELLDNHIDYEARINVRLPKKILISFHH